MSEEGSPQRGIIEQLLIARPVGAPSTYLSVFFRNDNQCTDLKIDASAYGQVQWGNNRNPFRTKDYFALYNASGITTLLVYSISRLGAVDRVYPLNSDISARLEARYDLSTMTGGPGSVTANYVFPHTKGGAVLTSVPALTQALTWLGGISGTGGRWYVKVDGLEPDQTPVQWARPIDGAFTAYAIRLQLTFGLPQFECLDERGHVIVSYSGTITGTFNRDLTNGLTYMNSGGVTDYLAGFEATVPPRVLDVRLLYDLTTRETLEPAKLEGMLPVNHSSGELITRTHAVQRIRPRLSKVTEVRTAYPAVDTATIKIVGGETRLGGFTIYSGTASGSGSITVYGFCPFFALWREPGSIAKMGHFDSNTTRTVMASDQDSLGGVFGFTTLGLRAVFPWLLWANGDKKLTSFFTDARFFVEYGSPAPTHPLTLDVDDPAFPVIFPMLENAGGLTQLNLPFVADSPEWWDEQAVLDNAGPFPWDEWLWEWIWDDATETGFGEFDCNRAVILCHPDTPVHPPAAFLAKFPGGTAGPMKLTGSGRVSENMFTTQPEHYEDEPVLVYTVEGTTKLMLPQELQSTGDDLFIPRMRTGIQPAPGEPDSHRLEAIELFLRRGAGVHPGTQEITVAPITSDILDKPTGHSGIGVLVPGLNDTSQPVRVPVGMVQRARFLGLQLFGPNTNCVFRYLGAILRGRDLDQDGSRE